MPLCKQLGSGWEAELLGVSPRSKLFDTQTICLPILSDIEAIWKLKQTRNFVDDKLLERLRPIEQELNWNWFNPQPATHYWSSICKKAWIWIKRRIIWRFFQIQAVWHSDNISKNLGDIEVLWKLKQTRNLADDNLFSGLRLNKVQYCSSIITDQGQTSIMFNQDGPKGLAVTAIFALILSCVYM